MRFGVPGRFLSRRRRFARPSRRVWFRENSPSRWTAAVARERHLRGLERVRRGLPVELLVPDPTPVQGVVRPSVCAPVHAGVPAGRACSGSRSSPLAISRALLRRAEQDAEVRPRDRPDEDLPDALGVPDDREPLVRGFLQRPSQRRDGLALAQRRQRRGPHDLRDVVQVQAHRAVRLVREKRRVLHLEQGVVQRLVQRVRGPLRDGDAE